MNLETMTNLPSLVNFSCHYKDMTYANIYGRTYYDSEQQAIIIPYGGAGFEIKFCGSSLFANFICRLNEEAIYMQVLVDDEKVCYDQNDILKGSIAVNGDKVVNCKIVENLPYGEHTVKVLRRSLFDSGEIGLVSLETDGFIMPAPKKPKLKIDIYGDSITAGYGVCDGNGWSSANSNGLLAYGYLLSEKLGAQSNIMGHSGWGVYISTGNSLNPEKQWYDKIDLIPNTNQKWDLSSFVPDLVIINLGTNDGGDITEKYTSTEFISKYKIMITSILEKAPNAFVLLCYGMMGKNLTVDNDIKQLVEQFDNEKITYLPLENFGCWTGEGKNGHPTPKANKLIAEYLYEYIISNYSKLINLYKN